MDFICIRDIVTGKTISVVRESPITSFVAIEDDNEPVVVQKRSIGKVIRTWMREREKDEGRIPLAPPTS